PTDNTVCAIYINKALSGSISGMRITSNANGIHFNAGGNNLTIRNCIIDNCQYGIYLHNISNTLYIYNNLIVNCDKMALHLSIYNNDRTYYYTIKGNIIAYNKEGGIYYNYLDGNNVVYIANNNVYENGGNYHSLAAPGTGDISKNPRFIDAESGNYVLQSSSPCINSGVPGMLDPDGSRSDMGPYATMTAKSFWPYPQHGPIVKELSIIPSAIPKGGKLSIKATGEIR
ncbi:MAG: hypothetical protein OMM_10046, partial [Candidatus Magnetoglobus multicellularis str. Araruama]